MHGSSRPGGQRPTSLVALAGLPPVYVHGLVAGLAAAALTCSLVPDLTQLPTLLAGAENVVVVLPAAQAGVVLPLDAALSARHPVVLVADDLSPATYADGLRAGATGVTSLSAELDDTVDVIGSAAAGQTLLPTAVAQALCRPSDAQPPQISDRERSWLRALAAGRTTVAGLARSAGYSEREMYRLLSGLYARLGASTRTQALLVAERGGLLDEPA